MSAAGTSRSHERFVARRIGRSVHIRPITAHIRTHGVSTTLVLGGTHGDEPKSVDLAKCLIDELSRRTPKRTVVVVPIVNPDGYEVRRRVNGSGVDLNRNFPTVDWTPTATAKRFHPGPDPASEPETRAVMSLVESTDPDRIITIHSINLHRFCVNYDGPARRLAKRMAATNGYPLQPSIGYPTPGSLGTWAGRERRIPVITLELPSHHSSKRCRTDNILALLKMCE